MKIGTAAVMAYQVIESAFCGQAVAGITSDLKIVIVNIKKTAYMIVCFIYLLKAFVRTLPAFR